MSIADALFTDSQSRVFRWLFGQPERSYHLSELRRLTGLGSASLQRELNKLAEAGLGEVGADRESAPLSGQSEKPGLWGSSLVLRARR